MLQKKTFAVHIALCFSRRCSSPRPRARRGRARGAGGRVRSVPRPPTARTHRTPAHGGRAPHTATHADALVFYQPSMRMRRCPSIAAGPLTIGQRSTAVTPSSIHIHSDVEHFALQ